jgi:putative transposase
MTKTTLQSILVDRPEPATGAKQHMFMDKGYDYPEERELLEGYGYTIHTRLRGEYRVNCKRIPRYRAGHWIVERTHSWMNSPVV